MTWLIAMDPPETLPAYFSPKVARQQGNAHGWTANVKDALEFPDEAAARTYAETRLPMMQVNVVRKPGEHA